MTANHSSLTDQLTNHSSLTDLLTNQQPYIILVIYNVSQNILHLLPLDHLYRSFSVISTRSASVAPQMQGTAPELNTGIVSSNEVHVSLSYVTQGNSDLKIDKWL